WRMLGTDPDSIAFNLYRAANSGRPVRLNPQPITAVTSFVDSTADAAQADAYFVRPVLNGREEPTSAPFTLKANTPVRPHLAVPLQTPAGYVTNDISVGDLDGDGDYELVVKEEQSPRDNSQRGTTGQPKLAAYKLDGTLLWRIDLGKNIREGAHYTQFMVYDLDGDGRA